MSNEESNGSAFGFIPVGILDNFKNKKKNVTEYVQQFSNITNHMFRYENIPEELPINTVELMLQTLGVICVAKYENKLYALQGAFSEEPNAYQIPTKFTVSNPYIPGLGSKVFTIGKDCVVIRNDTCMQGLLPIFNKYASLLAENDITLRLADINTRYTTLLTATTDDEKASADLFMEHIENGDLAAIASNVVFDGVKTLPYASGSDRGITSNIEYRQYLKASFFNAIGVNANYNMKRESINGNEADLNNDSLIPLVEDMYQCRLEGWNAVNELFGTEIQVSKNSIWAEKVQAESEVMEELEEIEPEQEPIEEQEEISQDVESESQKEQETKDEPEQIEELTEALEDLTETIKEEGEKDATEDME